MNPKKNPHNLWCSPSHGFFLEFKNQRKSPTLAHGILKSFLISKRAEMEPLIKVLFWIVIFAILLSGVYLLFKNMFGNT